MNPQAALCSVGSQRPELIVYAINAARGTTQLCDLGIILVIYFLNLLLMSESVRVTIFAPFFKMIFWLFPHKCADAVILKSVGGLILSVHLICTLRK